MQSREIIFSDIFSFIQPNFGEKQGKIKKFIAKTENFCEKILSVKKNVFPLHRKEKTNEQ